MNRKNLIFTAVLCVALVFGFSSCENPDDNEELLERIEQLENQLKDQQSGKDEDKTDSADKDSDKDNSSDNEQNGEGTPDPDEGEEGGDEGGSSSSTAVPPTCTDYVDLGLSVKWATCNVGASSPEEFGCYFAWGETTPKTTYDWSTYKWCNGSYDTMTKYCTDSYYGTVDYKTILDPKDDAASVNMGGSWRMPTAEEQQELIDECTWTWTTLNGINGYNVKGLNGNSIFFPAGGYRSSSGLNDAGSNGSYWSSSLSTSSSDNAFDLIFYSDFVRWSYDYRYYGQSVRGVFSH